MCTSEAVSVNVPTMTPEVLIPFAVEPRGPVPGGLNRVKEPSGVRENARGPALVVTVPTMVPPALMLLRLVP